MSDTRDRRPAVPPEGGVAAGDPHTDPATPSLDSFLGDTPTDRLEDWQWLWQTDQRFPVRSHRGLLGRLVVAFKRLLRPLVKVPVNDLWDRQRVFNQILIERLLAERAHTARLEAHLRQVHRDHQGAIEAHADRLVELDVRSADGLRDGLAHNDALFARVDQKLDRYRRESRELWHRMGSLIAAQEAAEPLAPVQREQTYVDLERRHRGAEDEIAQRIAAYRPYLADLPAGRPLLDLGCGRGEALRVLASFGVPVRGVDASQTMVEQCRARGLDAEQGDLFEVLAAEAEASLAGVVSFHVVEHLPADAVERLVRLAWRALAPGGILILETPSPLSVVMAARNFWTDPTHVRPVHPASLEVVFRAAGFEPVHRLDLHPFPDAERLPEIDLAPLDAPQRALADQVNRVRDVLDDLLFGHRDFAMIGRKA